MKIGPKYKIARRLGVPIFEKTQTQKYALSAEKKSRRAPQRGRTEFAIQLIEKHKARYFYGVTEKQFKNYVKSILSDKGSPTELLFAALESRLDNVVWRIGFCPTHRAARQAVAHGHITVNGKRVYSPSYFVKTGDIVSVREGSRKSPLFNGEKESNVQVPAWIAYDMKKKEAVIKGNPAVNEAELMFDIGKAIQFYQR